MGEYDVILINPCGRTGVTVADSLVRHGVRVYVIEGPNARKMEDFYIRTLKAAVEQTGTGMIIPVFFPEVLASHRDEFPGVNIPLPDAATIRLLDNKISACRLADELGILQPRIYERAEDVEIFPTVLKRPGGQGGDSVYFPKTRKALTNLMKTASEVLIQDFIEGEVVSVDALRWDGFLYGAAYRTLLPKMKGVSTLRESTDAPELVATVRRILDHVGYRGVCGVDFIVEKESGKAYFLECNPRFSGGLESAIASGFDIPWLYYQLATGKEVSAEGITFRSGVRTGSGAE